jgi:hypothetical protein
VPGGPVDLAVQRVHVFPTILSPGEQGTAWVLVSNLGTRAVTLLDVAFTFTDSHSNTVTLMEHYTGTLEPGVTDVRVDVRFGTSALDVGTVTLTATLDPGNALADTNRTNNTGTQTFRVH